VALFLGIDGGGSKTVCVLGDQTTILGRGRAGGSNVIRLGEALAREALHSAIGQACAAANIDSATISQTCIGVAGAGREDIAEKVQRLIAELVGGKILVVGDMEITLHAAFGGGPGVIVIAGTGSIAFGRNSRGQTARAGGWGFAISDEGSGHWIGKRAVRAAMRARDEGTNGVLLEKVLKSFAVASADELVLAASASPPPDFAKLLPPVLEAAEAGDAVANSVLIQAGTELAELARIVIARLFTEKEAVPVAMSGGVIHNSRQVRETLRSGLNGLRAGVIVNADVIDPVEGALALARK
jgi:glucosamine kinase